MVQTAGFQGGPGHLFVRESSALATAWRRERHVHAGGDRALGNLLEGLVENFIVQVGRALSGTEGSPWGRTMGVLRISFSRGAEGLCDEFGSLRRCLLDALVQEGGPGPEASRVTEFILEAAECAVILHRRVFDDETREPSVNFRGLVVETVDPQMGPFRMECGPRTWFLSPAGS